MDSPQGTEGGLPPDLAEHWRKIASPANVAVTASRGEWLPAWHLQVLSRALVEAITDPEQSFLNLQVTVRGGKALDVDTPIPTPDGMTPIGKLQPGDVVFDERGEPCLVLEAHEPYWSDDTYEVRFNDGERIVTDGPHRWTAYSYAESQALGRWRCHHDLPHREWPKNWATVTPAPKGRHTEFTETRVAKVRTTAEMAADGGRFYIPVPGPLQLPEADLLVDPYILGYWLGDGTSANASFTIAGADLPHFCDQVERAGYFITRQVVKSGTDNWTVDVSTVPTPRSKIDSLRARLRTLGVLGNKHIPDCYLRASEAQRLALLQGLMDSDGGNDRAGGKVSFTGQNQRLVDGVADLMAGLGTKVGRNQRMAKIGGRETGAVAYRAATMATFNPFRLPRKAELWSDGSKGSLTRRTRVITDVAPVAGRMVRCISVSSPSQLYLAGESMVPTHNSTLASVWTTVWTLGLFEGKRILIVCATADLAQKFSQQARDIFKEWGPVLFGKKVRDDMAAKDEWGTSDGGTVRAVGVGGLVTGYGFDLIFVDDPIADAKQARSETVKKSIVEWYSGTLRTRLEPGGTMVLVMARWADDDLSGAVVEKAMAAGSGDPWRIIKIGALAVCPPDEDPETWTDEWGRRDGESFWPERWPSEVLARIRDSLPDPTAWDALYMQDPTPKSGNDFERVNWRYAAPGELQIIEMIRAWDLASSANKGDWTVGALLGRTSDRRTIVLDVIRGRWTPDVVEQRVLEAAERDGPEVKIRMETPKGDSGVTALHYSNLLPHRDFEGWPVKGKKEERASIMAGAHRRGRLLLPVDVEWAETLISEFERFPNGRHDDQVDACSLGFNQLWQTSGEVTLTLPEMGVGLNGSIPQADAQVVWRGSMPPPVDLVTAE